MDSGQQESGVRDASLHTALQATRMKIDGGDSTQWSPAGQVRKIKTPRALLPRERPLVTETHSSATPPKEYAGNGTGATTSTSSKAKITNVACQECQRKKCKCDGGRPRCRACEHKGVSECIYQGREDTARMLKDKNKQLEEENEKLVKENQELKTEIERLKAISTGHVPDMKMTDAIPNDAIAPSVAEASLPMARMELPARIESQNAYNGQNLISNGNPSPWIPFPQHSFARPADVVGIAMKTERVSPTMVAFREARNMSLKSVDSNTSPASSSSRKRPLSVDTPARQKPSISVFRELPSTTSPGGKNVLQQLVNTTTNSQPADSRVPQQQQQQHHQHQQFPPPVGHVEPQAVTMLQSGTRQSQEPNEPYLRQISLFGRMHPHAQQRLQQLPSPYTQNASPTSLTQQPSLLTPSSAHHSRSSFSSSSNPITPGAVTMTNTKSPSLQESASLTSYDDTGTDNSFQNTTPQRFPGYNPQLTMKVPSLLSDINHPSKLASNLGSIALQHRPSQLNNLAFYHGSNNENLRTPGYTGRVTPQALHGQHEQNRHDQTVYGIGHETLRTPIYSNTMAPPSQYQHQRQVPHQHQQQLQAHQQPANISLSHYPTILNSDPGLDMSNLGTEQYDHVMDVGFTTSDDVVVPIAMGDPMMDGAPVHQYDEHSAGGGGRRAQWWRDFRW